MASVLALGLVGAQGFATAPHSEIPTEVCTPAGYTISCAHSECENYVPGTCYAINEVSQQLVPNGNACVPAGNTLMMQAALLWNNRDGRGIPAIATLQAVNTVAAKAMQINIALMFDHWDIVSMKIAEILSVDPHNKMALFAKAVYGSEGVLAGVSEHDVKNAMISLRNADPNIFMAADNAIANKEMLWDYEFTHPMTVIPNAQCAFMFDTSPALREDYPNFECEPIPASFNPEKLAILIFGANNEANLAARVHTGKILAAMYPQAKILATGGALGALDRSEGDLILEAMPEYASRITVDQGARDTIGNALAAAKFLKKEKISQVLVVTATWHLPRGIAALRGVLESHEIAAKTYMVGAGNLPWNVPLGTTAEMVAAAIADGRDTFFDTAYSAGEITGRVRAIERPMTARDYTRGLGLFTSCDFA